MNMAVHGLTGVIRSGDEANTFYHDAHGSGRQLRLCDGQPAVQRGQGQSRVARRAPGGCPSACRAVNAKQGSRQRRNYLWISDFYTYLNEHGRAGFVMASSATDSSGKDRDIRRKLVETGHVDVMVSVGNNFCIPKVCPARSGFSTRAKRRASGTRCSLSTRGIIIRS